MAPAEKHGTDGARGIFHEHLDRVANEMMTAVSAYERNRRITRARRNFGINGARPFALLAI